ncbi:MAG: thioredoxin family protein [Chitinophagaceae bacterium]
MKKIFFAAFPVAALVISLNWTSDPLPIGAPIPSPDAKMKDISGKEISLKEAKTTKGLLVMFSCNTCPYVVKNQSRTYEACKYAEGYGIGVAILNSNEAKRGDDDSFEDMKAYAKTQGYNWYYLVDQNSALADAFGANRTPECFLFNGEGKLVYHGAIDDNPSDASAVNRKHLVEAIQELNAGKEVSVKESRSVGCSIKRL